MASKPRKSKRFRYNLETVLKVRTIREKQEQELYNKALQKVAEEKAKEEVLREDERREYLELREMMSGSIQNLQGIMSRKVHIDRLKERIIEQEKIRIEAEAAAKKQQEKLVEAMRQKKIMLKDKDKKRMAWKKFMEKEDIKFLDDIATIGYENKRRIRESELPN